jgi:hypothetical protein
MNLRPPLVHVGYIKTGTTYLQERVWNVDGNVLSLAAGNRTRAVLTDAIIVCDDYTFDPAATRKRLEKEAEPVRARGQVPVWSEETILGNPPSRSYEGAAKAARLHQVFPDAQVLITIRRQQDIILSMYGEYLLGGGRLPFRSFIGDGNEPISYTPILRPEFLRFHHAIAHYQGLFGVSNVLVLPLELMSQDPGDYFGRMAAFCGIEAPIVSTKGRAHVGQRKASLELRRRLNRFVNVDPTRPGAHHGGLLRWIDVAMRRLDGLLPSNLDRRVEDDLNAQIAARYRESFSESNRLTARLVNLDLAAFGYDH